MPAWAITMLQQESAHIAKLDSKTLIDIVGTAINGLAFLFAVITFSVQAWFNARAERREAAKRRELDEQQLEARKTEIYQRLEIESNNVFKFEADNKDVVTHFKCHLARQDIFTNPAIFDDTTDTDEARLIARKFYENTCNLFEVSARLRRKDIVDHVVFGSWVAWFFDTVTEWGFRAAWADLRDNYTEDLRMIFDDAVNELVLAWDIPHFKGEFTHYAAEAPANGRPRVTNGELTVSDGEFEAFRRRFYTSMADKFDCEVIRCWLDSINHDGQTIKHPLAFR